MAVVQATSPLVVVADVDSDARTTVAGFMAARGYDVKSAADPSTAMGLLVSGKVDVLISDLAAQSGGLELLSFARESAPSTRSIAIAATASAHDRDLALRLGAVRVLVKPLSLLELADAVGLARDCGEGFHGWMHRMQLVDVLQMYHHSSQTLTLRVRGDLDGEIAFLRGELIHAQCGQVAGMEALIELLGVRRGQLESVAIGAHKRTINRPFEHVLLDGLRALDELNRLAIVAPALPVNDDGWDDWGAVEAAGSVVPFAPPASGPVVVDPIERTQLLAWLAEFAPGAALWRVHAATAQISRIDEPGSHPEFEFAGTIGGIGWAYELAEAGDPGWTRCELTNGATAVSLIRCRDVILALARPVAGDAMQRRFQTESARLALWLANHLAETAS